MMKHLFCRALFSSYEHMKMINFVTFSLNWLVKINFWKKTNNINEFLNRRRMFSMTTDVFQYDYLHFCINFLI